MKRTLIISLAVVFVLALSISVLPTLAITDNADAVVAFNQGTLQNGGAITDPARMDPTKALGAPDLLFVSLGFDGSIILAFPNFMSGNLAITTVERTNGAYPVEKAEVFVSSDAINWASIGTADNDEGANQQNYFTLPAEGCIKYVKLVDTTSKQDFVNIPDADGFDLDAVQADYDEVCSLCPDQECKEGDDKVKNSNEAFVVNKVEVEAETGDNFAGGSYAGNGGDGGDIEAEEGSNLGSTNTAGNGGTGGNSALGGTITTGNATARAGVINLVNTSDTEIDRCACEGDTCDEGDVRVYNRSRAAVFNDIEAEAETGDNEAEGSYAGNGGDGGDMEVEGQSNGGSGNTGGTGANGGTGADGALVQTGEAVSESGAINVVNRNITRVRR